MSNKDIKHKIRNHLQVMLFKVKEDVDGSGDEMEKEIMKVAALVNRIQDSTHRPQLSALDELTKEVLAASTPRKQLAKAVEELNELSRALSKVLGHTFIDDASEDEIEDVMHEMADVVITMRQVRSILFPGRDVEKVLTEKMQHVRNRIKDGQL